MMGASAVVADVVAVARQPVDVNAGELHTLLRGGIRWQVRIAGSGPAVLLLHGTGASNHSFRSLVPLLAHRFTVVIPDLPGHAGSWAAPGFEPTLPSMAAALEQLLDALEVRPILAIGHSAGAAVMARMTLDHGIAPRLLVGLGAAIVPLRGVAGALLPRTARLLSFASRVVPFRVRTTDGVERLLKSTGSSLDRAGVEQYRALSERPEHVAAVLAMMASWDLEPLYAELPQLDVPFLLLAGATDRAVPLAQQRMLLARTPRAKLTVVPRAGHLLHEEQPETVARLVLEALDAL